MPRPLASPVIVAWQSTAGESFVGHQAAEIVPLGGIFGR
jgi:hypothetical protein